MSTARSLLGILGGLAAGYAAAALILGLTPTDFGVAVAISAACVLGIFLIKAIQEDQQRDSDKAYHPAAQDIGFCLGCGRRMPLDTLYLRGGLCLLCTHERRTL